MQEKKLTHNQWNIWTVAALAAPAAHLAAALPWYRTLEVWLLAAGIRTFFGKTRAEGGLTDGLLAVLCLWAAGLSMGWMETCWQGEVEVRWILILLLLLSAWMAAKGRTETAFAGIFLWWPLAILFGSVLGSAVPEITWENLREYDSAVPGIREARLLSLLLIPGIAGRQGTQRDALIPQGSAVLLISACAQGVLGIREIREESAPFYMLSRSVRLYGLFQRMEALAWLGLMLGTFLALSYLLRGAMDLWPGGGKGSAFWMAAAVLGLYWQCRGEGAILFAAAAVFMGYFVPWMAYKRKMKKYEKI